MPLAKSETKESIEQSKVVPMLKKYLQFNDFALEVDDNGICAGLAAAFCKYALQDKEDEFISMLKVIHQEGENIDQLSSTGTSKSSVNNKSVLNKFIAEILYAFLPHKFNKTLSQDDGSKELKILVQEDNIKIEKKLVHQYNLGLTATVKEWEQIFKKLQQAEGCAITLSSPTHSVAISIKNGEFRLYDPSHNEMNMCKNSKEFVNVLATIFPQNEKAATLLPLAINVFSHPEKPLDASIFPDKEWIVRHIKDVNQGITINSNNWDSLAMASLQNDVELINLLFTKGAQNPDVALQVAARDNKLQALALLLEPQYKALLKNPVQTVIEACDIALTFGRAQSFDILMKDDVIDNHFKQHLQNSDYQKVLLKKVAATGSSDCVTRLFDYYENNIPGINLAELISAEVIDTARKAGSKCCLELFAKKAGIEVPIETAKEFPKTAEETNIFIAGLRLFTEFLSYLYQKASALFSSSKHHGFFKLNEEKAEDILGDDELISAP